jgi:cytochrome c-type biogenesis protein CcmH
MRYILLLFLLTVFAAQPCSCQEISRADLDKSAYRIYQQVFSPFCPGRSLNDCPSSKAHDLKMELREQLAQGISEADVLEGVFVKYGDKYRAIPRYVGFGKLVWWIPLAFILLGGAFVLRRATIRKRVKASLIPEESIASLDPELQSQIERELSRFD